MIPLRCKVVEYIGQNQICDEKCTICGSVFIFCDTDYRNCVAELSLQRGEKKIAWGWKKFCKALLSRSVRCLFHSFTSTFPSSVIPSTLMCISSQVELLKNSTLALPCASVLMSGCHQMVRRKSAIGGITL